MFGQSPFRLSKSDYIYGVASFGLSVGAELSQRSVSGLSVAEIGQLDANDLNAIDRGTAGQWNKNAKMASDFIATGLILSPVLLFADGGPREDFWTVAVMGAEAAMLSYGLVGIAKSTVLRPRPFLYPGSTAPLEEQMKRDARFSFFSGHTAFPATALFYGASVYSAYHPDSKWKPLVWTLAAAGPMLSGYLRVRAGKHFPTDVATGYVVGAGIGLLVPWMHRNQPRDKKLSLTPIGNGLALNWSF